MTLEQTIKLAEFAHGAQFALDELAEQIIGMTRGTGADGGVVGLSGGIDSTTVAYICKYAFDKYNQKHPTEKPLKFYGICLPSNANNPNDTKDGLRVAKLLKLEEIVIPIEPLAKPFVESLETDNKLDRGNLYSEIRAIVLSRFAAKRNLRVMGTGNRDEDYVLGYFTKRGDGAVDNNILGNLPKRLVRNLASFMEVPEDLVKRTPTAGLWQGQTDEGELGYTYSQCEIVQNGYDQGFSEEQIQKITGYDMKIIKDVAFRHKTTEHKRNPPTIGKVTLAYR